MYIYIPTYYPGSYNMHCTQSHIDFCRTDNRLQSNIITAVCVPGLCFQYKYIITFMHIIIYVSERQNIYVPEKCFSLGGCEQMYLCRTDQ